MDLIQYLVSGISIGSAYALIAIGFNLIYNATGIINFAQGEFVMLGGMGSVYFYHYLHFPLIFAILSGILLAGVTGILVERLSIRPIRDASILSLIIVTIGDSILIRGIAMLVWDKNSHALPSFSGDIPIRFLGAAVSPQYIWIIVVSIISMLLLGGFFRYTITGKAMLASSVDPVAARLVGINVERVTMYSFFISALFSGMAGALMTPVTLTSYDIGISLGLKGFAAAVVGGLGRMSGALVGGIILGIVESFSAGLISSGYKDAITFGLLLLFLYMRPQGIVGEIKAERV